MNRARRID